MPWRTVCESRQDQNYPAEPDTQLVEKVSFAREAGI